MISVLARCDINVGKAFDLLDTALAVTKAKWSNYLETGDNNRKLAQILIVAKTSITLTL